VTHATAPAGTDLGRRWHDPTSDLFANFALDNLKLVLVGSFALPVARCVMHPEIPMFAASRDQT
jgi:hypothetical protein